MERYKPKSSNPPPNLKPFQKGQRRLPNAGRKKGTPNKVTVLTRLALEGSGARLGFPRPVFKYIEEQQKFISSRNQVSYRTIRRKTDEILRWEATGEEGGGLEGYLMWLGLTYPNAYATLLGRLLPMQIDAKLDATMTVTKRFENIDVSKLSLEETQAMYREAIGLTKPLTAPAKVIDQDGNPDNDNRYDSPMREAAE